MVDVFMNTQSLRTSVHTQLTDVHLEIVIYATLPDLLISFDIETRVLAIGFPYFINNGILIAQIGKSGSSLLRAQEVRLCEDVPRLGLYGLSFDTFLVEFGAAFLPAWATK